MSSPPQKSIEDNATTGEPTLPPTITAFVSGNASLKRPAPSLLPAFEPLSSSPSRPRPTKRQALHGSLEPSVFLKYPTPIPSSSTGILSSSPPRVQLSRPGLARAPSTTSERPPLATVPSVELSEDGETLTMGRSSHSSQFQLSPNRLISRVHVKVRYIPAPTPFDQATVEIICNGWNGLKLHCQGRTWELSKNDVFTSETENAVIMLDVQDARVMINWPKRPRPENRDTFSESSWDEDSPRPRGRQSGLTPELLQSSPLRRETRIRSPVSPSPDNKSVAKRNDLLLSNDADEQVEIYEDPSGDDGELPEAAPDVDASFAQTELNNSFSSDLSDPDDDPDEENDPFIHSFGPFGANLSNRLAAFTTQGSPNLPVSVPSGSTTVRQSVVPSAEPEEPEPLNPNIDVAAVTNHVVNQLAFSRLSCTPLSAIMNNLPSEQKEGLSKTDLRRIIESTRCIGIIARHGKDAAGKPLESEYYYVPEHDADESRRFAVTDGLRKPSLRACRKQHKSQPTKIDLNSLTSSGHPTVPPAGPTSPQLEKDAARAMSTTDSWKPSLGGRKQSYAKEDQKRAIQMSGLGDGDGKGKGKGEKK
ncbi:hypothetical protein F4778DRAFT_776831 [Xylariomycetidae sp. FL2044]|nr:hypothetical protein F4778DRAFT_776831 [Xylariomycetidae sp. FL2044]